MDLIDLLFGINPDQAGVQIAPAQKGDQAKFVPVKDIYVDAHIQDSIAVIKMTQEYYNPKKEGEAGGAPLEATFMFPKEQESVISKMTITIGDKVVYTKVMEKEKA